MAHNDFFNLPCPQEISPNTEPPKLAFPLSIASCRVCRSIVADSTSFLCAIHELGMISIVDMVSISVENKYSVIEKDEGVDAGCSYRKILCSCTAELGRVYTHTSNSTMDPIRHKYTCFVSSLTFYTVGNPGAPMNTSIYEELFEILHPTPSQVSAIVNRMMSVIIVVKEEQELIRNAVRKLAETCKLSIYLPEEDDIMGVENSSELEEQSIKWKERFETLESNCQTLQSSYQTLQKSHAALLQNYDVLAKGLAQLKEESLKQKQEHQSKSSLFDIEDQELENVGVIASQQNQNQAPPKRKRYNYKSLPTARGSLPEKRPVPLSPDANHSMVIRSESEEAEPVRHKPLSQAIHDSFADESDEYEPSSHPRKRPPITETGLKQRDLVSKDGDMSISSSDETHDDQDSDYKENDKKDGWKKRRKTSAEDDDGKYRNTEVDMNSKMNITATQSAPPTKRLGRRSSGKAQQGSNVSVEVPGRSRMTRKPTSRF